MTTYVCCVHLAVRNRTKAVPVLDSFVQFIYFHGNFAYFLFFLFIFLTLSVINSVSGSGCVYQFAHIIIMNIKQMQCLPYSQLQNQDVPFILKVSKLFYL